MRHEAIAAAVLLLFASTQARGDVAVSKHNLSASGPGSIVAENESRICIFCHTPHGAAPAMPLWNHRSSPVGAYATYSSSTLASGGAVGQPDGASKLCLSCHDGTVALGQTVNDGLIPMLNAGPGGEIPNGPADLGTDLTDDHPISFRRSPTDATVTDPLPGDPVKLDTKGRIQCTSCHDPHEEDKDPVTRRFLVKDNRGSGLCLSCHRMGGWKTSGHEASAARYTASEGAHTGYTTVRDNGCASCHRAHAAKEPMRLLKLTEEETCVACHDGSVAATDIASEFSKPFAHPTFSLTPSMHDAAEEPTSAASAMAALSPTAPRHAECQDCHNPHAGPLSAASAPGLPGAIAGTWGVDATGLQRDPIDAEYQLCFRCHGDSVSGQQAAARSNPPRTPRVANQLNVRLQFDPVNPSHHAVVAPGRNPDVPSLVPPYDSASTILCTDCHNSDSGPSAGGRGPGGPHGSIYPKLLERRIAGGSGNSGSDTSYLYALCFKCHSEASILSDETFTGHRLHLQGAGASCLVCHDPHGVSAMQGNSLGNSHLINFDTNVVKATSRGELRFEDLGSRTGSCYLTCHGVEHDPQSY